MQIKIHWENLYQIWQISPEEYTYKALDAYSEWDSEAEESSISRDYMEDPIVDTSIESLLEKICKSDSGKGIEKTLRKHPEELTIEEGESLAKRLIDKITMIP